MIGFKKKIVELLQKKGFVVSKTLENKSRFFVAKGKIEVSLNFSKEGTALLQYYTKAKNNIKDFFDNGNSDSEIIETVNGMFDIIAKIQKIEVKIEKKEQEINKLKEEILNTYNTGA